VADDAGEEMHGRILITGSAGLIGTALWPALERRGWRLRGRDLRGSDGESAAASGRGRCSAGTRGSPWPRACDGWWPRIERQAGL